MTNFFVFLEYQMNGIVPILWMRKLSHKLSHKPFKKEFKPSSFSFQNMHSTVPQTFSYLVRINVLSLV